MNPSTMNNINLMRFPVKRLLIILCLFSFALNGCSAFYGDKKAEEHGPIPELSCVAVLPVMVPVTNNDSLSPMQKKNLQKGALYLDSVLADELKNTAQFRILTENQLDAILGDPWGGRLQQVRSIGQATRCGAVLKTDLTKYRQRIGSNMSIETSAAAAFSMELIDVKTGMVFWTTSFDENQKSLFEDIFSYNTAERRGFQWLSVEELSRDGVQSRLKEFPYFQKEVE